MERSLPAVRSVGGVWRVPGDKSITHRALLLGALAEGVTIIEGPLDAGDTRSTAGFVSACGASVRREPGRWAVEGRGLRLDQPSATLDCGNSGTLLRLGLGVLAGQPVRARLDGDESLRRRPMDRVAVPLRRMGARIECPDGGERAPLEVIGGGLSGIEYVLPVASAQVKSALLLAGVQAGGRTTLSEPEPTRDHTERMLAAFGVPVELDGLRVGVRRSDGWAATRLRVPGDISSAIFPVVAALITEDSEIVVEGVGLNPRRIGALHLLRRMGASLEWSVEETDGEPVGWIRAATSRLSAIETGPGDPPVASYVDEVPAIAAAAAHAQGVTVLRGLAELRVKESDRLAAVAQGLSALGVNARAQGDDLLIEGGRVAPAVVDAHRDHRIAMALGVAGLPAGVTVRGAEWAEVSYPGFFDTLAGSSR
jgi:3-phosphoshikimate 1-carboxyvinyltransferase